MLPATYPDPLTGGFFIQARGIWYLILDHEQRTVGSYWKLPAHIRRKIGGFTLEAAKASAPDDHQFFAFLTHFQDYLFRAHPKINPASLNRKITTLIQKLRPPQPCNEYQSN